MVSYSTFFKLKINCWNFFFCYVLTKFSERILRCFKIKCKLWWIASNSLKTRLVCCSWADQENIDWCFNELGSTICMCIIFSRQLHNANTSYGACTDSTVSQCMGNRCTNTKRTRNSRFAICQYCKWHKHHVTCFGQPLEYGLQWSLLAAPAVAEHLLFRSQPEMALAIRSVAALLDLPHK